MSEVQKTESLSDQDLFSRVVAILEQARSNVVRAVNSSMVMAYWLIGREIVQELQGGEDRAEYGKQVLDHLSDRLTSRYGKGFSVTNLKYFRLFYQAYPQRMEIRHPTCDELTAEEKLSPAGRESKGTGISNLTGRESNTAIGDPPGSQSVQGLG